MSTGAHGRIRYYAPDPAARFTLPSKDPFAFMDEREPPRRAGRSLSISLVRCATVWCGEWVQTTATSCKTCGSPARPRT